MVDSVSDFLMLLLSSRIETKGHMKVSLIAREKDAITR